MLASASASSSRLTNSRSTDCGKSGATVTARFRLLAKALCLTPGETLALSAVTHTPRPGKLARKIGNERAFGIGHKADQVVRVALGARERRTAREPAVSAIVVALPELPTSLRPYPIS